MRFLIALALVLGAASAARADIPMPKKSSVAIGQIDGVAALALYNSMDAQAQVLQSSSLALYTVKVLRAKDGLNDVTCQKRQVQNGEVSASCSTRTSTDGTPLTVITIHPRLG